LTVKNKFLVTLAACAVIFVFSGLAIAQMPYCSEPGSIKRVTKSRSGNFELVTFEVIANDPNYEVKDAKPPFYDYSGEKKLRIKGNVFKSIVLRGINWTCRIRENFSAPTSTIMGIKNVEQFEGQVEYVIGYRDKSKFVSSYVYGVGSSKVVLKFKK
jgi:hypothetical protein